MNKQEIVTALSTEHDLFDPVQNTLYVLDATDNKHIYGVQIVHFLPQGENLAALFREYSEEHADADKRTVPMSFAFTSIPAAGACCGCEYGYITFIGFSAEDGASEDDAAKVALADLSDYAKDLVEEGIGKRLIIDEDIPEYLRF